MISPSKSFLATLAVALLPFASLAKPADVAETSVSAFYEDARARAAVGDLSGAVIQLKNVLQHDPNHLPARIALGKYLLRQRDAKGAEKEMRLALNFGGAPEEIYPTLGNALMVQRKFQEILDTFRSRDGSSGAAFVALLFGGRAHYELGQLDKAEASLRDAQTLSPDRPEPYVHLAELELARGRPDEALRLTEQAIAVAPNDTDPWHQKGVALVAARDYDGALAAYNHVLEQKPGLLRTRLARGGLYLKLNLPERARADAEFVRDANPDDIQASFLLWQAATRLGDADLAREASATVAGRLSAIKEDVLVTSPYLLRVASLVTYGRGDLERADRYLTQFVQLNPNDKVMLRLMGRVKLKLGEAREAIRILYPLYRQNATDADVLLGLGEAYMRIGHYSEAAGVLEQALQLNSGNPTLKAQLALSRAGLGDWDEAIAGLEEAVEVDAGGTATALLLALIQQRRGDPDAALATLEAYIAQSPPNPKALNLLGIVQASRGDPAAARQAFKLALVIAPAFLTAEYNLAKLELAEGNVKGATGRLERIVERDRNAVAALMLLADIAIARNDDEAASRWLEKAVSGASQAIGAQARLADLHLSQGRPNEALAVANRLTQKTPENALAVETLANIQLATGKRGQAARNYRAAARYAGYDGAQLMRIARKQVELEDYDNARRTLVKATNSSASILAAAALVRLDIRQKLYDAAEKRIVELSEQESTFALSHILRGELLIAERQPEAAIAEFALAHEAAPSSESIIGLFDALDGVGRRAEAMEMLEQWVAENPQDVEARRKLALWYLPTRQFDKARPMLEELLVAQPRDPVLLSNLARLYQLDGDARARVLAERAVAARPDWPVALDTLGWILVTENETSRGLEYLRDAIARDDNPLTRYHLAQALNELGRVEEAKQELRRILNSGYRIAWMSDVQSYYDSIASVPQP